MGGVGKTNLLSGAGETKIRLGERVHVKPESSEVIDGEGYAQRRLRGDGDSREEEEIGEELKRAGRGK